MRKLILLCITIIVSYACRKSNPDPTELPPPDLPLVANYNCTYSPDYGDSLIYSKWRGPNNDYFIKPKNNTVNGTYFSWPQGLVMNSSTGQINVSQSETGIRYVVGFVKSGSTDTCLTRLILGGATYIDSIYVLGNNDTLALPYFDANPVLQTICESSDDNDYPGNSGGGNGQGNDKCEFDDDDDVDGPGIEPPPGQQANAQKIRVRTISGIINLKKTLADGAFGDNPKNGDQKEVTIYYRLNDGSGKALQKIKVNLVYYERKTDIPAALVNEINNKRNEFLQKKLVNPRGKPRPPQIIITRFAN